MPALFVMRHAEPAVTGVLLGQSDPPLSAAGALMASRVAELLPPTGLIFSSPLLRARQTALFLHPTPEIVPEFTEITYGKWDGLSWNEIETRFPQQARAKIQNWESTTPFGGETWKHFSARVRQGLSRVRAGALPAIIVAHEAVNAVIACEFGNQQIQSYKQNYCEFVEYRF
jgi:broad specificity phosphatase PhoE